MKNKNQIVTQFESRFRLAIKRQMRTTSTYNIPETLPTVISGTLTGHNIDVQELLLRHIASKDLTEYLKGLIREIIK